MKRYVVARDEQGIHQIIDKDGNYREGETYEGLIRDFDLEVICSFDSKYEAFDEAESLDKMYFTKLEEL